MIDKIEKDLLKLKDSKYKDFQEKLGLNNLNMIGVRMPVLRKYANKLLKQDYLIYLNNPSNKYFETILLEGILIASSNLEIEEKISFLDKYIPKINNWATCDLSAANLKQFKKNQEQGYEYIKKCIKDKNIWKQRLGIVLLNDYYINDTYINNILEILPKIKTEEYYIQMAIAWCLSTCYIKYPNLTISLIKEKKLNKTIHNKTIQKIIESTKTSKEEKEKLKQLKIKA